MTRLRKLKLDELEGVENNVAVLGSVKKFAASQQILRAVLRTLFLHCDKSS